MSVINELITNNLDIWSSTVKKKKGVGRGSSKKIELYGVKKLRELILDLAVRGLLVPQDSNDEHAGILLKKIAIEKDKSVKEGKIKKQKQLSLINDDEKPFDLPNGWEWVRLGNIGWITSSRRVHQKDWVAEGVPFYRAREIVKLSKNGNVDNELFVSEKHFEELAISGTLPIESDIMLTGVGTIGFPYVVKSKDRFYFKDASVLIFKNITKLAPAYLDKYFRCPLWNRQIHDGSMGTTVHTLTISRANEVLISFPPIKEQTRIADKVDELMQLCDQLEQQQEGSINAHQVLVKNLLDALIDSASHSQTTEGKPKFEQAWERIAQYFHILFTTEDSIYQLKQTILQLAVIGKLVPQSPGNETAGELLKKIALEKEKLIQERKIKKQKPLLEISESEKKINLPESWEWSRIGDASLVTEYGISAKTFDSSDGIPVLKMGDIQNGKVILGGQKKAAASYDGISELMLENGDVLYNRTNSAELVGKTGLYDGPENTYSFASYLIRIQCGNLGIIPEYLNLNMNAPLFRKHQITPHLKQQCGQANVNGTIMKNMLIAIAPRNEQKRIVKKVVELIDICDQLKANILASNKIQLNLSDTIAQKALN